MPKTIVVTIDGRGVANLTLDRPDKHNALSSEMIEELADAARSLATNGAVRAIILGANGKSFCAGGDLNWMRQQMTAPAKVRAREARKLAEMLQVLNTLPKPLIGRVHANAFGGGIGLACICDVVIADDRARFGLTETRLGLIPATIGPYVVARMGEAHARQVFMSSRLFDCADAVRLGIVSRMVSADELDRAVEAEVTPYLACAPGAVAQAKALTRRLGPVIDGALIDETIQALIERWKSPESEEGIAAFFEKRPAQWAKPGA